jgi:hypothetical protein
LFHTFNELINFIIYLFCLVIESLKKRRKTASLRVEHDARFKFRRFWGNSSITQHQTLHQTGLISIDINNKVA